MGAAGDPQAAPDGAGRVRGVQGLCVCDASLMPSIPRANTATPSLMIAERIADLIRASSGYVICAVPGTWTRMR